jgi:hypothetical protein
MYGRRVNGIAAGHDGVSNSAPLLGDQNNLEDLLEVYLQGLRIDNLGSKINNYSQNAPLACWAVY